MNKAESASWPDEHRADEPGIAGKIYGKIKEWGGLAKKAGVMFKDSPELQKQAAMTVAGSAASIIGVKSFYDVPEYLRERFMVRGMFGKGKGVEGSVEDLLSKNWQRREGASYEPEAEYDIEEHAEVRQAIGDLNKRLKLTKEGGQKGSEQRNMIAKLLKENRIAEKDNQQERKEKITEVLDNYTTTKITGLQAARESLNTFLSATGAMALRGVSYGMLDAAERYQRLNKQARVKEKKSGQAQEVNFLKDMVAGGFKETWDELRFKDKSGKKTGVRKGLDFIKASGKVMRYLGLGYSGLHNETLSDNIDKMLYTLEGKISFSDMGKNFVGNIERTYESYKSFPGRVGALAKAGGSQAAKGLGAVGQFASNYVFGGPAEGVEPGQLPTTGKGSALGEDAGTKVYSFHGTLKGGIYGPGKIFNSEQEMFEQLKKDNPRLSLSQLLMRQNAAKADAQALVVLDKQYDEAMKNNPQEAVRIKEHIIINKNNFEKAYGKSIKLNLKSLTGDLEKQDAGEVKAEEAVEPKIPLAPFNKGGEVADEHTPGPSPEGKEPAEVELEDIEIGLVKKGKGIEQSLYKQIIKNFGEYKDDLKFRGDATNRAQINKFAQQQAHALAEKMGYVETAEARDARIKEGIDTYAGKKEIRVRPVDQVAYILGKDEKGELTVKEYLKISNERFRLVEPHYLKGEFNGEGINKYEYVHSSDKAAGAKNVQAEGSEEAEIAGHKEIEHEQIADVEKNKHQTASVKRGYSEFKSIGGSASKLEAEPPTGAGQLDSLTAENQKSIHGDLVDKDSWRKELYNEKDSDKQIIRGWVKDSLDFSNNSKLMGKDVSIVARDLDHNGAVDAIYITDNTDKDKSYNIAEFHGPQAAEKFGADLKSAGIEAEKYAHKLIDARLEEFEKITDNKIPLERAEELGIRVFSQNGLAPRDTAKLEFIKGRGFNSSISYEEIKARFKIYDELKGTEIDLKQIDKYYNAVKDIKEPAISAKLIKIWDEPSEINLQHLLQQLKPLDPKAGFEKLTAGKRHNGDLVINYITKGHNEGNYMIVFSANGQVLLERPDGAINKYDHISDLRNVLSAPGKMIKGAGGAEKGDDGVIYWEFTDSKEPIKDNNNADAEEGDSGLKVRWFKKLGKSKN